MESLKSLFNNLSDTSKSLIKIMVGVICALVLMFIVVLILRIARAGRGISSFEKLETAMEKAAIKYYKNNKEELPENGEESVVEVSTLISEEYMKELEKYVGKETSCEGSVYAIKNNTYYSYIPYLDCQDKYTTKMLSDAIIADNDVVDEGSGLYTGDDSSYIFRGEFVNNYLIFAEKTWRIISVNGDGTIKILLTDPTKKYKNGKWDDRYNIDKGNNAGINDFTVSRIREKLNAIYNDDSIFSEDNKSLITPQDLCIGARDKDSEDFSGNEECSETLEGDYLGLLQVNEFLRASIDEDCSSTLDPSCSNYNYLANLGRNFWTITPVSEDTYHNYRISKIPTIIKTSSTSNILLTINLSSKTRLKEGTGTKSDPYVVVGEKVKKSN